MMRHSRIDLTSHKIIFCLIQPIAASPSQQSSSRPSAPQLTPIQRKENRTLQNSDTSDSESSSVRRIKREMKKQRKETIQQKQTIIQVNQQTHGHSSEIPFQRRHSLERRRLEAQINVGHLFPIRIFPQKRK